MLFLFLFQLDYKDLGNNQCTQSSFVLFFLTDKTNGVGNITKYNRICVTLSDENNQMLNSLVGNSNKNMNLLTKSNVVNLGLNKLFENATSESIAYEIQKQSMVD